VTRPSRDPAGLSAQVAAGDVRAAARLMRLLDDEHPTGAATLSILHRASRPASLVGVTGAPGSGKSTLIDRLITAYRARDERVGVVAIDPTSPFTGGAILGDRVRMQSHVLDPDVFVRSLATRGQLGGLSRSTSATVAVMEGMGFGRVIVETVGIGQSEVDVARVADTTLVVLAPGLGDDVQALKAGLMEVADVYVVNKADRPGADRAVRDVENVLDLRGEDQHGWRPPVIAASSSSGDGIDAVLAALDTHEQHLVQHDLRQARRLARARLDVETALLGRLHSQLLARVGSTAAIIEAAQRVVDRASDVATECQRLLPDDLPQG